MLENVSVIQGLIATKGWNTKGFFICEDDKMTVTTNNKTTVMTNDKTTVTLFLRAPLVAIGAQKIKDIILL